MANADFDQIPSNLSFGANQMFRRNAANSAFEIFTATADAFLPSQTSNSGKFLTTNGTNSSWATIPSGITIGTTAITSGADNRLLFQSGGLVSQLSNTQFFAVSRTLPTTVGHAVQIGSFDTGVTYGGTVFEIWISTGQGGYVQSKKYSVPCTYDATSGAWKKCFADKSTGVYSSQDFDLEVQVSAAIVAFRLRRVSGTTAGTALVTILQQGLDTTTFTPSTTSGTVTAPTANYEAKADNLLSDRLQIRNAPTIANYPLNDWNSSGHPIGAFFATPTHNGGSSPATGEPALVLGREGVGATSYANYAEFLLGRYEHNSTNSRTFLDFALHHGNAETAGAVAMRLRSDKRAIFYGDVEITDGKNIIFGTSTGTIIGQTGAKLSFFGATAIARPTIEGTTEQEQIDYIVTALVNLGLASDGR